MVLLILINFREIVVGKYDCRLYVINLVFYWGKNNFFFKEGIKLNIKFFN